MGSNSSYVQHRYMFRTCEQLVFLYKARCRKKKHRSEHSTSVLKSKCLRKCYRFKGVIWLVSQLFRLLSHISSLPHLSLNVEQLQVSHPDLKLVFEKYSSDDMEDGTQDSKSSLAEDFTLLCTEQTREPILAVDLISLIQFAELNGLLKRLQAYPISDSLSVKQNVAYSHLLENMKKVSKLEQVFMEKSKNNAAGRGGGKTTRASSQEKASRQSPQSQVIPPIGKSNQPIFHRQTKPDKKSTDINMYWREARDHTMDGLSNLESLADFCSASLNRYTGNKQQESQISNFESKNDVTQTFRKLLLADMMVEGREDLERLVGDVDELEDDPNFDSIKLDQSTECYSNRYRQEINQLNNLLSDVGINVGHLKEQVLATQSQFAKSNISESETSSNDKADVLRHKMEKLEDWANLSEGYVQSHVNLAAANIISNWSRASKEMPVLTDTTVPSFYLIWR